MKIKKIIGILLLFCAALFLFSGCSANSTEGDPAEGLTENPAEGSTGPGSAGEATGNSAEKPVLPLADKVLFVYCGAGMTKPFAEIAEAFQNETGADVEVTYGNAVQTISQIKASDRGDLFIAGDKGELSPIQEDYVAASRDLVRHIPVLAVQEGNPKNIGGLADLAQEGVTVVLGDYEATPIGKIAVKALTDAGIFDAVEVIAQTTTAPEIATALSLGNCDAAIIWKENTRMDGISVVDTEEMDKYIKMIPAASLTCSTNAEALAAFLEFLDKDTAKNIWEKYGYELVN